MRRLAWSSLVLALVLLVGAPGWQHVVGPGEAADTLQQRARRFAASRHRRALSALRLAHLSQAVDPLSGKPGYVAKLVDDSTGASFIVTLNGDGSQYDHQDRRDAIRTALQQRRGTITAQSLQGATAPGDQERPTILWLRAGRAAAVSRPAARGPRELVDTDPEVRALATAVDESRASGIAPIVDPVVARLRQRGRVPRSHRYAPAVSVSLTAAEAADVARWPEVDRVYLDEIASDEMDIARPSLKASIVHNRGYSGNGIRISVIEVNGRIATHSSLEVTQDTTYVCGSPSTHSTAVAGMINSLHPSIRGVAPGALLWASGSCSGLSSQLQDRANAAVDWGARAVNLSWGGTATLIPGANDRFFDDFVLNRHVLVVKSAGNRAGPCNGDAKLTSPALAYNLITVGGYDDRNTVAWEDDIMDDCSSYVNPSSTNGDREKPEVVAPSMNVQSTLVNGTVGNAGSGTSWASAEITGVAALLMQRAPTLQFWPEAVKAILMATAIHNIEGDRRLSDLDGTGGVSVDRADDVVRGARGGWDGVTFECDINSPLPGPVDIPIVLEAGRRARATIAWDTDTAYNLYELQPGADLDLTILDAGNAVVASSSSLDNTYEVVDFYPVATGTYTLRISTARCDISPRYLGWAWWREG
ncbi:MAG: S8 family serine peptidase [Vicinamibacterales bacterium]